MNNSELSRILKKLDNIEKGLVSFDNRLRNMESQVSRLEGERDGIHEIKKLAVSELLLLGYAIVSTGIIIGMLVT